MAAVLPVRLHYIDHLITDSNYSTTITLAYTAPASLGAGVQTDTAGVTSAVSDPTPANDSASDSTTVVNVAVLTVTTDDGLSSVVAGTGGHQYTITVTNGGPSDAHAVVLDDPQGSHFGGQIAAPVFHEIMSYALAQLRIPPTGAQPAKLRLTP